MPLAVPYAARLRSLRQKFGGFVREGDDFAQSEEILAAVAESSAGAVGEIEQEQEREQEQEQQKEQQKEQEIEMERYAMMDRLLAPCPTRLTSRWCACCARYVDLAYLREGEEPVRWAFCSLGKTSGTGGKPTPFAEGTFYSASEFCLNARSPLPFPSYLSISKNSFNREWAGERCCICASHLCRHMTWTWTPC